MAKAPKNNSLIDTEFEDDENDFSYRPNDFRDDEVEVPEEKAKPEPNTDLEIEVVDDTPDKDKGKWVADPDKDGEPDLPDEEEIKQYSKDVQKRISKATARIHAERRRADDAGRQLQEAAKLAENLLKQNEHLRGLVENGEKVLVSEHKSRLESQVAQAKQMYREAHEAGDVNGMMAAQENLAKAVAAIDRVSVHRSQPLPKPDEAAFKQAFQPAQPSADPKTQEWQEKNRWFGRDEVMTAFAMGLHTHITQKEGIRPEEPAYWKKIDGEMRKRFPERFEASNQPRRTQTIVASANRSSGAARKVTLTESEVKLARRLGITNEQYARQKLIESGN